MTGCERTMWRAQAEELLLKVQTIREWAKLAPQPLTARCAAAVHPFATRQHLRDALAPV